VIPVDLLDGLLYLDPDGRRWLALSASASWTEPSDRDELEGRRQQWWSVDTWMIPRTQAGQLVEILTTSREGNRSPSDPPNFTDDAYIGEIGRYEPGCADGSYEVYSGGGPTDLRPVPGSARYVWESQARDGSLHESVVLETANPQLISAHRLRWDGNGGRWLSGDQVIVEYHAVDAPSLDGSSVVLFDEELLRRHLSERDLALVVRLRGERQIYRMDRVHQPWMEVDAVGVLDQEWRFGARELTRRFPAGYESGVRRRRRSIS
jgi:hypothetical protein